MRTERVELLNDAFEKYEALMNSIEELYKVSEEYLLPTKPELNEILSDAKHYMSGVFIGIANANDVVTDEEQAFIDKFDFDESIKEEFNKDSIFDTIFSDVPKYIELAVDVDKLAQTDYATKLIKDTLFICRCIMDIDGNTYANESSYTYAFIDMLEKYKKDNK